MSEIAKSSQTTQPHRRSLENSYEKLGIYLQNFRPGKLRMSTLRLASRCHESRHSDRFGPQLRERRGRRRNAGSDEPRDADVDVRAFVRLAIADDRASAARTRFAHFGFDSRFVRLEILAKKSRQL